MCDSDEKISIETKAIQAGQDFDPKWHSTIMVPPIVNSMTFYQFDPANIDVRFCGYFFVRFSNYQSLKIFPGTFYVQSFE